MRFNRIFYQILVVFVLVIIVCLVLSGWYMMQISGNIITQNISESDQKFAGQIAQEIEAEMASVKPILTLLSESTGLRLMEATAVKGEINRVQRSFSEISSIYVANMEGEQIARTDTGKLENVSMIWNFQVVRGGDEFVSDIYFKPTISELMQTITLPIIDNGVVVGVLSADINFRRVMVSVMDIDIGKNGNVIVIADNGRVVAHTRIKQVPELDLSKLPIVEAVLAGQEGTMKGYTDELGRQVLGSYMPIRELGWGVVIQRSLADIDDEVGQLRTTILWVTIFGIFLSVLVGALMSRQITKPIQQLASASERVAQGDLSTLVDVKSSNEVGVLARSFNQMIVSLKKSRDELQQWGNKLEKKVEERTRELKDAQDKMIRKEKLAVLGQIAGGMAHELRNPLGVISNAAYFLKETLTDADKTTKEYLDIISSEVNNAEKIVSNLLDLSRTKPSERAEAAVSELILKILDKKHPPRDIKVTTNIPKDISSIFVDSSQISQVLTNLITNAYQAMTDGGSLTINARKHKNKVYIEVVDTGCGIPKKDMEKIFEPLYTTKARGIGLGLSVSKNLVEVNGGSIKVESTKGKGATFTVVLPAREAL
ncbi:MAG: HAMP domain-containing protein [Actinobacteria bacterium]|nr:HAMP domain-containing protein [Actinomycetota bacterium]